MAINSATTLLIDANEPVPVQKAASDLASDMEKVFGARVQVVHRPADAKATTIWIGLKGELPKSIERPSGWEKLTLQAVRDPLPASPIHQAIVLTGADMRGTIYAIYQFSQEFLGVDPLYWWTDHPPARRAQVLVPSGFKEVQGPPTFRYRGWFINDEDLLTGWKPGLDDGTGISLETWDRVFEAILRLKGNMVCPSTFKFPYEPQVVAAGERGLILTQHHVETLGLNTYRWPSDQPYSFISHADILTAAWKRAVSQYRNSEIIWTVGYRGQHDRPFWTVDKDAPSSDEERARVISTAIEAQMAVVRSTVREPIFIMNAWQESSKFAQEGFLHLPEGVSLVWPDNGQGLIQDGGTISKGQGVYYHTAMISGRSNHFTEGIPLERIARELGRTVRAGATNYLLDNTANVRPVVMTTRALMELAWQADPWTNPRVDQSSVYLEKWCKEEFGAAAAPALQDYYRAYFAAPARYGEQEDATMEDHYYQSVARRLLLGLIAGNDTSPGKRYLGEPEFSNVKGGGEFLAKITAEADSRWSRARLLAEKAKPLVPADRQDFFQASVLTQVDIHVHSNRILMHLARAAADLDAAGQSAQIRAAIAECEKLQNAM
ncbi:MAG: glycosyl hydrolase 115 family protein, partial [Terriglobia bacterium]